MLVGVRTHDVQFMMTKMQKLNSQCALLGRRNGPRMGCWGKSAGAGAGAANILARRILITPSSCTPDADVTV